MILRPDGGYDSQDEAMIDESEEEITIYAEEGDLLVIQRALNSQPVLEDLEQRDNLFHSRCNIQDKVCHLIIDSGSCANIASVCLVEKLGLKATPHPRPYKLKWLNDKEELKVSKQVEIPLSIGQYKDQILCDVAPMQAGHVLLGRPWQYDRNVAHNGRTNEYSFSFNHCKFILAPLPQKEVRILQSRAKGKSSYFAIPEFLNFDPPDIMHLPLPRECFAGFREPEIKVQELSMDNIAENVMLQGGDMMYHKEKPPLQKFKPTLELEKAKNIPFVQLLEHLQINHQGKLSDYKPFPKTNLGLFDADSTVLRTKPLQEGEYDISMEAYIHGDNKKSSRGAKGDGAKRVAEEEGDLVADSGGTKELRSTHHQSLHSGEPPGRATSSQKPLRNEEEVLKLKKRPKELFMESSLCFHKPFYSTHLSSTGVYTSCNTPDQVNNHAQICQTKGEPTIPPKPPNQASTEPDKEIMYECLSKTFYSTSPESTEAHTTLITPEHIQKSPPSKPNG